MITFLTYKWRPLPGYRSTFRAEHVNTWGRMVSRHYDGPHRKLCVTDDPEGIDSSIETIPLWSDFSDVRSPHGERFPSCYRRLKMFSREAVAWLGPRFAAMDLDLTVTGNLRPLVDRDEDFVAWGDTSRYGGYNGSFIVHRTGTRSFLWEDFDPARSPQMAKAAECFGSDQGWISYRLGKTTHPKFTQADGVYSYQNDIRKVYHGRLPDNARVVFFHGRIDPWSWEAKRLRWVEEHYR